MMRWFGGFRFVHLAVLILVFLGACRGEAMGFFAGARGGTSFGTGPQRFYESEAYFGLKLPRDWNWYSDWRLDAGAEASTGWINDGHVNGFIGALGPFVELGKGKFPVTLELGASPTLLSKHAFDAKNFGDDLQFTSYFEVRWTITDSFALGARMQHMSNGGFARPNPGVNFWMLSARYNF
jgi:Lipid A 3-O-deacylase (PagL)